MEHLNGQLPITIGGARRTLFFNNTTVSILSSLVEGGDFEAVFQTDPFRSLPMITLAGLLSGDDVNELPENLTERQVSRWLMAVDPAEMSKIMPAYRQAMGFIIAAMTALQPDEAPEKAKKPILKASQ